MMPEQVVNRARASIGGGCIYGLGKGGFHPSALYPWNMNRECDCSGFASWCLGVSRLIDEGHPFKGLFMGSWLETSAIYRDASDPAPSAFQRIDLLAAAPGDLYVFGDRRHDGHVRQGHVAVISSVGPQGPEALVHCSAGNWRTLRDAIQETEVAEFWKERGAIVARSVLLGT
jgi:hypothetical protein